DSVILTEVRRVGQTDARSVSGKTPPIRDVSEPESPSQVGRSYRTKRSGAVKPPPPTASNREEASSPPPFRSGTTASIRARTRSGKFRAVAGPGGPSKALSDGKPEQAELVSNGVKVTASPKPPPEETSRDSPLDEELSNIM